jgi:hypothetical protein
MSVCPSTERHPIWVRSKWFVKGGHPHVTLSCSGPIVSDRFVFTTETKNKESEVALALDRKTRDERWRAE